MSDRDNNQLHPVSMLEEHRRTLREELHSTNAELRQIKADGLPRVGAPQSERERELQQRTVRLLRAVVRFDEAIRKLR